MDNDASLPFFYNDDPIQWTEDGAVTPFPYDPHASLDEQPTEQFMASVPSISHTTLGSLPPKDFSCILETEMEKQKQDLEHYLHLQNEQLIATIHQQKVQQASLINMMQSNNCIFLRQKENELENAQRRAAELEELLRRAEEQKELWQKVADVRAATAAALCNTLEQVQEPCCSSTRAVGEEEGDPTLMEHGLPLCKLCGSRESCMLLVPCQHLCMCKPCVASQNMCPVCGMVKSHSLEILLA